MTLDELETIMDGQSRKLLPNTSPSFTTGRGEGKDSTLTNGGGSECRTKSIRKLSVTRFVRVA